MSRRAIICGGSIGGLFAASALRSVGWQVDVFERTAVELSGRGAGIVTHDPLIKALQLVGASVEDLGVEVTERVAFDRHGSRVASFEFKQIVTSWDRMHQVLRAVVPDECHHLGRNVIGYREEPDRVVAKFDDGNEIEGDMIVGADGFRSAIRAQMQPDIQPSYAGYVVWRALAHEADLPDDVHRAIFDPFSYFIPNGSQIIGYPIAGPNNDLRPGHRRYNFVWYMRVPTEELHDMLTDAAGQRHTISIPPPLVRDEVLARMETDAAHRLPPQFVEVLKVSERPFFTPIYDHHSPIMGQGRVALLGDAACVARPHVGMGVTKAALDAIALARHVKLNPVSTGLMAYSAERVGASLKAYDQAQRLGSLIFDTDETLNKDGRDHPQLEQIMRETAVVI